jgi:hypothetical protein
MSIIFDGNYDAANAAEKFLKIDFDKEFVTAQERTALSNRGSDSSKPSEKDPEKKSLSDPEVEKKLDQLRVSARLVAEMLDAGRIVTLKNDEVL